MFVYIAVIFLAIATEGCTALLGYDEIAVDDAGAGNSAGGGAPAQECASIDGIRPPADACGVFVSAEAGDDADGRGTKDSPFRTLARALSEGKTVYACSGAPFEEAITATGQVTILGGFDCNKGWDHVAGQKTVWRAPADQVPLLAGELSSVELDDIALTAADSKRAGGSSIALIAAAQATVELRRCEISAGAAGDGETPGAKAPGMGGLAGYKGHVGCFGSDIATAPGLGGAMQCASGDVSGGSGGAGLAANAGSDGSDGSPAPPVANGGHGGKKQSSVPCSAGTAGEAGGDGAPGAGATAPGAISQNGYTGSDGQDGSAGGSGQGGGGGGGAKTCFNGKAGPSGGGGGSGGCGGGGGSGGRSGGSSIAVVSLNASLSFVEVRIVAGKGGRGGDGGPGATGGGGGSGAGPGAGDAIASACSGGKGGDGGKGGRGGGGHGGHSIGIAHRGPAPEIGGATLQVSDAGKGGAGDGPARDGAPGAVAAVQAFE